MRNCTNPRNNDNTTAGREGRMIRPCKVRNEGCSVWQETYLWRWNQRDEPLPQLLQLIVAYICKVAVGTVELVTAM
jgi:hypothetical protein